MSGASYRLVRRAAPARPAPELDEQQRRVVAHAGGPLLVLAGPGTGKTTTIVETVVDRIENRGIPPERVLVLTFGRKAAGELRERVAARLHRTTRTPLALTFHSYAYALLRREAVLDGEDPPRLLSGPEHLLEVRRLLEGEVGEGAAAWPKRLRETLKTRGFAEELRDFILRAAERGLGPEELVKLGRAHRRDDWYAAGRFLHRYNQRFDIDPIMAYDYAELVRAAAGLLADERVRGRERAAYDVILVDEYQDTDPAQEYLLRELAGGGRELIVVGDPDQSIYGFRGADVGAILEFPRRFRTADGREAPVVSLRTCRRMSPEILEASRRLARRLPVGGLPRGDGEHPARPEPASRAEKRAVRHSEHRDLATDEPPGPKVRVVEADSASQEAALVADELRRAHLLENVPWSNMAVLVRSAVLQVPPLRRALTAASVPVLVAGDEVPLAGEPGARPFIVLLRSALRPELLDEEAAEELITGPIGGADALALRRLRRALSMGGAREVSAAADAASTRLVGGEANDPELSGAREVSVGGDAAGTRLVGGEANDPALREASVGGDAAGTRLVGGEANDPGPREASARIAGRAGGSPLVRALGDPRELLMIQPAVREPAERVARLIALARQVAASGGDAEDVLWTVWRESGLADRLFEASVRGGVHGANADRDLDAVVALFDMAARFTDRLPHAGPELFLDDLASQEIPADTLAERAPEGEAVRILTAHRSKGLEWDVVVIAGVQEGLWPDLRLRGSLLGSEELIEAAGGGEPGGAAATAAGLLEEERRLFYVAATRARRRLVVTAVGGEDTEERPSRFLRELVPDPAEHAQLDERTRWLSLRALVADLRTAACDPATPGPLRRAAAAHLARLARAGVQGAHPRSWYALTELSHDGPAFADDERIAVSPSQVETFEKCGLRWLLAACVGARDGGAADVVTMGKVIHAVAELVGGDEGASDADIAKRLDEVWDDLDFRSVWYSGKQRKQAEAMVAKFMAWHSRPDAREVVSVEESFRIDLGRVQIRGRVDRAERDGEGRAWVIDIKTSSTPVREEDLARHPQLGVYQLAVMLGAFADRGLIEPGGAELIQVGKAAFTARVRVQAQPSPSADEDPEWPRKLVDRVAKGMASPVFEANRDDHCRSCPVQSCCPAHENGGQVTGEGS